MGLWGYTSLTDKIWLTDEIPGRHRMTSKWGYTSLTDEMPRKIDASTGLENKICMNVTLEIV